jgi:hypothetical protein
MKILPWIAYYIGAVIALRFSVLWAKEKIDRNHQGGWRPEDTFTIFVMVALWPIVASLLLSWRLAFPRGVQTRWAREQRAAAIAHSQHLDLLVAEGIVKDFAATHSSHWTEIEASTSVVVPTGQRTWSVRPDEGDHEKVPSREAAEAYFDEACQQVWRERGQPWSIGALANVRTRAKAATR